MTHRPFVTSAVTISLVLSGGVCAWAKPLNPKQSAFLKEQAVPAYQQGLSGQLVEPLARLVAQLDSEGLRDAEKLLRENSSPPLAHLLLAARMSIAQQGGKLLEPRPNAKEILLLLPYIREQISSLTAEVKKLPAMNDPPARVPALSGYEKRFSELRNADGALYVAASVAYQATSVQQLFPQHSQATLDPRQRDDLECDFRSEVAKLVSLRRRVVERAIRLHLFRLQDAVSALKSSTNVTTRWRAAHLVDVDGALLTSIFAPSRRGHAKPGRFLDNDLNDPQVLEKVQGYVKEGLELAGDITPKTRILHTGLSWWLRARYGQGTHVLGLLKSEAALNSPAALVALSMPPEISSPTDPSDPKTIYRVPKVERRHHYTWAWEQRTVQTSTAGFEERFTMASTFTGLMFSKHIVMSVDRTFQTSALMRDLYPDAARGSSPGHWLTRATPFSGYGDAPFQDIEDRIYLRHGSVTNRYLPAERADIVKRLVGFIEYANALDSFDRLIAVCTPKELKVIDELIYEDDRYAVYTNLSRLVASRRSTLAELPRVQDDDFQRRGLAWVMGLARVELAAMLSAFAYQDNAFAAVVRNPFGIAEYKEFVQDGMRTHLATLRADPFLRKALSDKASVNRMLAYFRRVSLARKFVQAAAALSQGEYAPSQLAELKPQFDDLAAARARLAFNIHSHLGTSSNVVKQKWYERSPSIPQKLFEEFKKHGYDIGHPEIEKNLIDELKRRGIDPGKVLNQ